MNYQQEKDCKGRGWTWAHCHCWPGTEVRECKSVAQRWSAPAGSAVLAAGSPLTNFGPVSLVSDASEALINQKKNTWLRIYEHSKQINFRFQGCLELLICYIRLRIWLRHRKNTWFWSHFSFSYSVYWITIYSNKM